MNNIAKYLLIVFIIGGAIFSIFYLIFTEVTSQMIWCVISAILFTGAIFSNMLTVTSSKRLTVKKVSLDMMLYLVSGVFFGWTLLYVFLSDKWSDPERDLTTLYIGYLIILVIGTILIYASDIGGNLAQNENENIQSQITSKRILVNKVNGIILKSNTHSSTNNRDINRMLGNIRSMIQSIPSSSFKTPNTFPEIEISLCKLETSISNGDETGIKVSSKNCMNTIKKHMS